ncbi:DIS3-like exonuclease 2 [Smittium culicis]|uniref:DIS3-like exonuclease 2 n=1 Tax=Smittium culicis TaxID=133412 RepID=A0A1R1YRV2_9FUNG|nr:DIS3-like exonuclease 2 [Smittium culicis]
MKDDTNPKSNYQHKYTQNPDNTNKNDLYYLLPTKNVYSPYLNEHKYKPLLASGKLYRAQLRVNKADPTNEAFATINHFPHSTIQQLHPQLFTNHDVFIYKMKLRNRAFNGDTVIIKIFDKNDSLNISKISKADKLLKRSHKPPPQKYDPTSDPSIFFPNPSNQNPDLSSRPQSPSSSNQNPNSSNQNPNSSNQNPNSSNQNPDLSSRPQSPSSSIFIPQNHSEIDLTLAEDTVDSRIFGEVVAVVPTLFSKTRKFACSFLAFSQDKHYAILSSLDPSDPKFLISYHKFISYSKKLKSSDFKNVFFHLRFSSWDKNHRFPTATILSHSSLNDNLLPPDFLPLYKNSIFEAPFPQDLLNSIPNSNYSIPNSEILSRVDLRNELIFTIDPPSAKDLDDALSIRKLDHNNYLLGVHIADASFFIKPGSKLDTAAKISATTVYLVNRNIPMIPRILSADLCSLLPGKERLTFSVFWVISNSGQIIDYSFQKSIICSTIKLSYDQTQAVIDGKNLSQLPQSEIKVSDYNFIKNKVFTPRQTILSNIDDSIRMLNDLSITLRSNRFQAGALSINDTKLYFEFDPDGNPIKCYPESRIQSKNLIEEFMLLANTQVAHQLFSNLGPSCLLRRHPDPIYSRILSTSEKIAKFGYNLDCSSSKSLMSSLNSIKDSDIRYAIEDMIINGMNTALYFCTSDLIETPELFRHYSLNVPIYTHFTSPIRRYADILVHRQLSASLITDNTKLRNEFFASILDTDEISMVAENCNNKKRAAKQAQDESIAIYFTKFISFNYSKENPLLVTGVINKMYRNRFKLIIPEFGIDETFDLNNLLNRPDLIHSPNKNNFYLSEFKHFEESESIYLTFTDAPIVLTPKRSRKNSIESNSLHSRNVSLNSSQHHSKKKSLDINHEHHSKKESLDIKHEHHSKKESLDINHEHSPSNPLDMLSQDISLLNLAEEKDTKASTKFARITLLTKINLAIFPKIKKNVSKTQIRLCLPLIP